MIKESEIDPGDTIDVTPILGHDATTPRHTAQLGRSESKSEEMTFDDWMPWVVGSGGALLAHSLASSLMEPSDEEERKESMWMRLLRTLIPLGVGAAGAYGGYELGKQLKTAQDNNWPAWRTPKSRVPVVSADGTVTNNVPGKLYVPSANANLIERYESRIDDGNIKSVDDLIARLNAVKGDVEGEVSLGNKGHYVLNYGKWLPWALGAGKGVQGVYDLTRGGWHAFRGREARLQGAAATRDAAIQRSADLVNSASLELDSAASDLVKKQRQNVVDKAKAKRARGSAKATAEAAARASGDAVDAAATRKGYAEGSLRDEVARHRRVNNDADSAYGRVADSVKKHRDAGSKAMGSAGANLVKALGWGALGWGADALDRHVVVPYRDQSQRDLDEFQSLKDLNDAIIRVNEAQAKANKGK